MLSRKKSRSALALIMGVAMLATLFAVPASADHDPLAGVAVYRGRAAVTPGINFPVLPGGAPAQSTWSFDSNDAPGSGPALCASVAVPNGVDLDCRIEASGTLGSSVPGAPLIGDGGYCGISRGDGGTGTFTSNGDTLALHSLGWITSAGSVLPVLGEWTGHTETGRIVSLVQASGNNNAGTALVLACLESGGANSFDVNGIALLIQNIEI